MTWYSKMLFPPFVVGSKKETVASPFPETAVTDLGAPGVVKGTIGLEAADAELVPIELVAVTVKV